MDGVDLTVAAGEIHALVGLNGAGKTTLMKMLLGMLRPTSGAARLFDEPVGDARPRVWSQVGHLLETPFGYGELTPTENVIAAARLHGVDVVAARRQAAEMIGELTLDRWADRRSRVLSLGNRQRLGLACALVHRPRLLILDEPSNGLDPMGVLELRGMLLSRSHDGVGVLVSSHHLDEVARIADRIVLMALLAGALLGLGPPTGDAWRAAGMDLAAGALIAALALPLAWVASARRGYLPAVAALLLIVVATQLIT
ncbi:MAG TPA: ABC transporter ATP-binding protein, partial [Nakamurella sp.]